MCESHQLQRNTAKVWQFTEKPHLQIRFWPFKPFRNDESPKRFLKLNYRTEFPCKNNHNTDHCLPDGMSNASAQQIIFSTYHDFQTYFDTKNAYLPFETSTISSLDITLAATRKKNSFDFLDERRKRVEKLQTTINTKATTVSAIAPAETLISWRTCTSVQHSILGGNFWLVRWKNPALDRS